MMDRLASHFAGMAGNNLWSNHRLHEACAELTPEELAAKRTSFFPTIRATLNHILIVDWYYLDALTEGGRGRACFAVHEPFEDFVELRAAQLSQDRALLDYCDGLDDRKLASIVRLDRGERGIREETAEAVLAHLFQHQIHHRGQIHAMLSGTSVSPPQLDEFFLVQDFDLRADEMDRLGLPRR